MLVYAEQKKMIVWKGWRINGKHRQIVKKGVYFNSDKGEGTIMSELYRKMQEFLGDQHKLMERMAGRLDLWEECVSLFPREEIIEEMDAALQREDTDMLYGAVHRLKGNLANFGFDSAAELAMKVLEALRTDNIAETKERYMKLRGIYGQIVERLREAE